MRQPRPIRTTVRAVLLVTCALASSTVTGLAQAPGGPKSGSEIRQKVDALVAQMTLDEKIGQLNQQFMFGPPVPFEAPVAKGQLGSLLFVTDPAVINHLQHVAVEQSRLHITAQPESRTA
jgi:beta-glucosidase